MTVCALDSKLTGVCLTGLIAVESHTYITARRTRSVVSILCHYLRICESIGRHLLEVASQNQKTSRSLD